MERKIKKRKPLATNYRKKNRREKRKRENIERNVEPYKKIESLPTAVIGKLRVEGSGGLVDT